MRHAIRWVLFDAVGTLIYPAPSVAEVYAEHGRRFGSQLTAAQVKPRFQTAFARPEEQRRLSEQGERLRWQRVVQTVFDDVPNAGGPLFESLWQHFAEPQNWQLFADVTLAWSALEERGLRIGIASNFDHRLHAICAAHAPLDRAAQRFVSSEVGYAKPDPRFFREVEQTLDARPNEILLVGDDPRCDAAGARAAEWHVALIDREGGGSSAAAFNSLQQLVDWLTAS